MDLETLRTLCTAFPGVTEDIKWEKDLCFCVGGKMFVVTCPDEHPVPVSFKCTDEEFDELIARPGFRPSPYLARHKWVNVIDITLLAPTEWQRLTRQSYELVKNKLPKKIQASLE